MKKNALFGSDFPSLSERAELDPFWVLDVKRLRCPPLVPACLRLSGRYLSGRYLSASSFFSWLVSCRLGFVPAGLRLSGCQLPALSCPARFRPSVVPTCLAGRLWLYLACVVLSGSFLAVFSLYLLGRVSLAVACLLCPVWLVSGRLRFLPAWLGVSGCYLPALSSLARFLPSLVCTCLVGCFWLLPTCSALSGSFPAVCGSYLLGWAFLAVNLPCVVLSGSFPAVSGLHLLGCVFLAVCRSMAALSWFLWFLRRCFSSRKLTSGHINA